MVQLTFPTDDSPEVVVQISGNSRIEGWEKPQIQAEVSNKEALNFSDTDGKIVIRVRSNSSFHLPVSSRLRIEDVGGNAKISNLEGDLLITRIGGNLKLGQVGKTEIEKVYGNIRVNISNGDLTFGSVYGNLSVSDVAGKVTVTELIKGNLVLARIRGVSARAMGNASLSLLAEAGEEYNLEASGNIHCYLNPGSSATIEMRSDLGRIRLDLPGEVGEIRETMHRLQFGDGEAPVFLSARGYVHLALRERGGEVESHEEDFDEVGDEINDLIERQMEALEKQINERLSHLDVLESANLSSDIDEIVDRARHYSTFAALEAQSRAEAAAQRAQAKLALKLEKARRRAEHEGRSGARQDARKRRWYGDRPAAGGGVADEVSDDERLLVLKMVEENKISVDEADQLLAALEGKSESDG
jgi:SHOCT-like domain